MLEHVFCNFRLFCVHTESSKRCQIWWRCTFHQLEPYWMRKIMVRVFRLNINCNLVSLTITVTSVACESGFVMTYQQWKLTSVYCYDISSYSYDSSCCFLDFLLILSQFGGMWRCQKNPVADGIRTSNPQIWSHMLYPWTPMLFLSYSETLSNVRYNRIVMNWNS